MQKWKLLAAFVVAGISVSLLAFRLFSGWDGGAPSYDWECAQCHYRFRRAVKSASADVAVTQCPKCKAQTAERVMHYQCRKCWHKYDLRGSKATLANIICPACGSRAARDLDHPIPGDDQPAQ
jgi:putative FmdB family regulatory protein